MLYVDASDWNGGFGADCRALSARDKQPKTDKKPKKKRDGPFSDEGRRLGSTTEAGAGGQAERMGYGLESGSGQGAHGRRFTIFTGGDAGIDHAAMIDPGDAVIPPCMATAVSRPVRKPG